MTNRNTYWAAEPLKEALPEVDRRTAWYYQICRSNRLYELWRASHWATFAGMRTGGNMGIAGEAGELTTIEMNELGNLYQHILNLITAQRPQFECQATNTDHRAQSQTIVGNAVVEYAMRERDLEDSLSTTAGYMLKYAEGTIFKSWNALAGPDYRPDPETNEIVKSGDVEYTTLAPWDLARDTMAESFSSSAWYCPRFWENRFDLMARYPELADEISSLPNKYETEDERPRIASRQWTQTTGIAKSDEVPVYVWIHKKSDALPDGRMIIYLSPDLALYDGPMPYRDMPLYRMAAMEVDGTTTAYSCLYDLLAPQQAINAVASTVVSNQAAFGVQNVWVPAGANLNWKQLRGGLNMLEGGTQAPQALNLLATKEETFKLFDMLRAAMERYSGINSTVRGNPEASLKSGAALALVYAQTIQFIALTQKAYIKAAERIGTGTLHDYQDFAEASRTIAISGEANRPYSIDFSSADIDQVDRVTVKMANPLTGTIAGRYNLGEMMLQAHMIDDPKQLMEVLTSGRIEPVYESPVRERMNIRAENEKLAKGEMPFAVQGDHPALHVREHMTVLSSPEARENPQISQAVSQHIQQHIEIWRSTDPAVLELMGFPVPPPPPGMVPPGMPPPGASATPPPQPGAANGTPPPHPGATHVAGPPMMHGNPHSIGHAGKGSGPAPTPMPGMEGAPGLGLALPQLPHAPVNPLNGSRIATNASPTPGAV